MTREIPIGCGLVALVDDDDFELVSRHRWNIHGHSRKIKYAYHRGRGGAASFMMHRFITGAPPGTVVDHVNGDGLDNRRTNLRVCTHTQNLRNRRLNSNNASGYKGVVREQSKIEKWRVSIMADGRVRSMGVFASKIEAARAYDLAAFKYYGEFARPNFSPHRDWIFTFESKGEWPPATSDRSPLERDLFEGRPQ